jgi:hypothetical protein
MNKFLNYLKTLGKERKEKICSFLIPNHLVKIISAPDSRRHMSPLLLQAIANTGAINRRSIIQAIRESDNPSKWGKILLALAAEIEITTILEAEQIREFEKDIQIID